jgi:hypothetical protein
MVMRRFKQGKVSYPYYSVVQSFSRIAAMAKYQKLQAYYSHRAAIRLSLCSVQTSGSSMGGEYYFIKIILRMMSRLAER